MSETREDSQATRLASGAASEHTRVIEAKPGWRFIDFHELWEYRDLFYFMVWRNIKVRYAQSVLGIGWAVIQPVFSMIVFTIVFGKLAKIDSEGVPYAIFSYTALVPWTYFSTGLAQASGSLISSASMISKVYFPRLIIPLSPLLDKLVDFGIALFILFGLMFWFNISPTMWSLTLPLLILLMMLTAAGLGLWLTALAIQYRDIKYGMNFGVRLLMYASPVVYPASLIPQKYRLLYGLNPMVGVIEGFRAALLGTRPMPWDLIAVGFVTAVVIALSGAVYFRRTERVFADVV
jgi:lipopolysaccharide transport system permease protein